MATMTHQDRFSRILSLIHEVPDSGSHKRAKDGTSWYTISVPRVGKVTIHRMPSDYAAEWGFNEVWMHLGPARDHQYEQFRGSCEQAAELLCKRLKAPSRAVSVAADRILESNFDGLRAPEFAAMHHFDEETTYKAFDYLIERGEINPDQGTGYTRRQAA